MGYVKPEDVIAISISLVPIALKLSVLALLFPLAIPFLFLFNEKRKNAREGKTESLDVREMLALIKLAVKG